MKIVTYQPNNELLKNYIDCFYILQRDSDDKDCTYFAFPSNTVFITLCQDAEIVVNANDLTIRNCPSGKIRSMLIMDNQKQGSTTYQGRTNEITIYFKPLGINAFLKNPLSNHTAKTISEFNPYEDYATALQEVFQIEEGSARIEFLEKYLLSKHQGFEHAYLHQALKKIGNENSPKISIAALARSLNISRVTLHKQFLLHIGTSPSQFIKIERFRSSIRMFTKNARKDQLVDIAYLAEYFDQSHMAKDFKSFTGYAPKQFFAKLSQIENSQISWIFS